MTKLETLTGIIVEAEDNSIVAMLNSGYFRLAKGEAMPEPEPEPAPEPKAAEDEAIDRSAFGEAMPEPEGKPLQDMSKEELKALAAQLGVKVGTRDSKAKLTEAIKAARG